MRSNPFTRFLTFLAVLCFGLAATLLPQAMAEELKPFLTIKLAGPSDLMQAGATLAQWAGTSDDFEEWTASFKDLKGLNKKNPIAFVLRTDGEELKEPILFLPITNVEDVELPYFEMITSGLRKETEGKYLLNTPLYPVKALQEDGYLVLTTDTSDEPSPKNPDAFLTDLKDYTIGIKIDLENTSLDAIEGMLAPVMMIMSMQGPEMMETLEQFTEQIGAVHAEFSSLCFGIRLDPNTSDLAIECVLVPRKDTDTATQIALYNTSKTMFNGFRGDKDSVFWVHNIENFSGTNRELAMAAMQPLFDGLLNTVGENTDDENLYESAEAIILSVRKVVEATIASGKFDAALSLDANGTLLGAITLGETDELRNIRSLAGGFLKATAGDQAEFAQMETSIKENLKEEYETIEGFKVSSLKIAVADFVDKREGSPIDLSELTLRVFWGVRKDEAIAFALGPDSSNIEASFKKALEQTKNPVTVAQPVAMLALKPLGILLQKAGLEGDETTDLIINLLLDANTDAKIELFAEAVDDCAFRLKFCMNGSCVNSLVEIFKMVGESQAEMSEEGSEIRDF